MLSSDQSRKTPLALSLNAIAARRASDAIQALGKELPAKVESVNGQLVTVSFQVFGGAPFVLHQVTVPISTPLYDWQPVQVGDLGVLKKSDAYLGGISGIGGGQADFTQRGNLSALYFQPVSNKAWTLPAVANSDTGIRVVQGPHGVGLQDLPGNTKVLINKDAVTITRGSTTVVIAGDHVTITVPHGDKVNVTAGGTLSPVVTMAGNSPVLYADGP